MIYFGYVRRLCAEISLCLILGFCGMALQTSIANVKRLALAAAIIASSLFGVTSADAFEGAINQYQLSPNAACKIVWYNEVGGNLFSYMKLININPFVEYMPGGSFTLLNQLNTGYPALTESALNLCGYGTIVAGSLEQNPTGDQGSPFLASDDYAGFSFQALDGGVTTQYEFAMSGVTNTVVISTATVVVSYPEVTTFEDTSYVGVTPVDVTLTFSESVSGLITDDFDVTTGNASLSLNASSGTSFTLTVTPDGTGGQIDITLAADSVTADDGGAAGPETSETISIVAINADPTADAGADQLTVVSGATVTLDGTGSRDSDGNIASYAWTRTGGTGGSITLSSASASQPTFTADTLASNDSAVTHIFSLVVTDDDSATSTADTVTITVQPPANADPTANAGADQSSVASAELVTLDGSASSDSDGSVASYAWTRNGGTGAAVTLNDATAEMPTFTAPTVTAGDPSVTLIFDLVVTDDDGADSTADSVTVTVNGGPTVVISGVPTEINGPAGFDATITFSKDVTGFLIGDITVTGGSVTALTGGPSIYTATIAASGTGDFSIEVPADVVIDGSGNGNASSNLSSATNVITETTQDGVSDFVQGQANAIFSTTPNVGGFLNGGGVASRNFNLNATNGVFRLNFNGSLLTTGSSKNFAGKTDVWASLLATRSETSTSTGEFIVGYLGAHRFVNQNLLVGGMVQFDYGSETNSATTASGTGRGFMVGPYVAGKIGTSGLAFEAQARWGRSFNSISPIGTYTDAYETERWMARVRLEGSKVSGATTITPNVNIAYFSETQAAYTDSLSNLIAAQTVTLGEAVIGSEFKRSFTLAGGNYAQAYFGLSAVTNFSVSSTAGSQAFPLGNGSLRGRLNIGASTSTVNGWSLSANGFYDGIGVTGYRSYGGTLKAQKSF